MKQVMRSSDDFFIRANHGYRSLSLALGGVILAIAGLSPAEVRGAEPPNASTCPPYIVFDGTASPDGRYAVAWALPKHPDVWAKICQSFREKEHRAFEDDESLRELIPEDDVENYLVTIASRTIIQNFSSHDKLVSNYWTLPQMVPSGHDFSVVWARTGNVVLVNHGFRTSCVQFCAIPIREDKAGSTLDLNKALRAAALHDVRKRIPRGARDSNSLNIAYNGLKELGDSKFSVVASVGNYAKDDNSWSEDAVIEFALKPAGENSVTLKVLNIRPKK